MGGLYRKVYTSFWTDTKVCRMSFDEKCIFHYLIDNTYSNLACCYEIPLEQAANGLSIDLDRLFDALYSLRDKWKVIDFDELNSEVLVCNRGKYDAWDSEYKSFESIAESCRNIKTKKMREYIEFLVANRYGEGNWDNEICSYYDGTWQQLKDNHTLPIRSSLVLEEEKSNSKSKTKKSNDSVVTNVSDLKETTKAIKNLCLYVASLDISSELKDALCTYYCTVKRGFTLAQVKMQLNELFSFPPEMQLESVKKSTMSGYGSFFKPYNKNSSYKNDKKVQVTSKLADLNNYEVFEV